MTYKTTGTLKEIGAKVGDVVSGRSGFEFQVDDFTLGGLTSSDYTIISRATPEGPVRTVTRKEIVPGVYGRIVVATADNGNVAIKFNHQVGDCAMMDHSELTDAIATLTEIRDAL